jgi:hypothetical protein
MATAPRAGTVASTGGKEATVTLFWFVIWFVCDLIGDREPLTFDPINLWAGTLLLAIALDLAGQHAAERSHR